MKHSHLSLNLLCGSLLFTALLAPASAATIVAYYKINDGNDETIGSSDTDLQSTAGNHVLKDAINTSGVGTNWNTTYEALGATDSTGSGQRGGTLMTESSFAAAQTANDYNSFSLTVGTIVGPNDGLDLGTYAFHYGAQDSTSPNQFQLTYQLNGSGGFATVGSAISLPQNTGSTLNLVEVDLTNIPTLATGDSVQFRLYGWGATNTSAAVRWGEQVLVGTYVPEPSSALLLMSGLGFLCLRRRRK